MVAESGTLLKWRIVPSSILTITLFPLTYTISPRSTFTSRVASPSEADLDVCTCACAGDEAKQSAPPTSKVPTILLEIISVSPCICPYCARNRNSLPRSRSTQHAHCPPAPH